MNLLNISKLENETHHQRYFSNSNNLKQNTSNNTFT
jgi:hypothetical protein